jgi:hypothetical protein
MPMRLLYAEDEGGRKKEDKKEEQKAKTIRERRESELPRTREEVRKG